MVVHVLSFVATRPRRLGFIQISNNIIVAALWKRLSVKCPESEMHAIAIPTGLDFGKKWHS